MKSRQSQFTTIPANFSLTHLPFSFPGNSSLTCETFWLNSHFHSLNEVLSAAFLITANQWIKHIYQ